MTIEDRTTKLGPAGLDEILAEYFRRLDSGESVDQADFCRSHPTHAEGLRRYFDQERWVAEDGDPVRFQLGGGQPPGRIQIRCPFCHSPQEANADTDLSSLTCEACGGVFSVTGVGSQESVRVAMRAAHFELIDQLGAGAFGAVWRAYDSKLEREVAVKIPRRSGMKPEEIEKFFREARAAAQLRHPNIVSVYEVGRDGDTVFIVSELIQGESLAEWLASKRPTFPEAARLAEQVASALQHAHERGVVHRDLKPGNILVDQARAAHIVDFGLARRDAGEVTMTVEGQILGTPAYMSPEQAVGDSHVADARSDVYSLGVVLYELLTGEVPFRGNVQMLLQQIVRDEPPSPRRFNGELPRDLETLTLKCLEKEPHRRYQSAGEVELELVRYLRGEPILARPISRIERALRWSKRKPWLATAVLLLVFLAVAGPAVAVREARNQWNLQQRFSERKTLIDQKMSESRQAAARIGVLERELAAWKGQANPWDFWPPRPDDPLKRTMALDLLSHARSLPPGDHPADAALRQLSIALLCEALGRANDAVEAYEAVCQVLTPVVDARGDDAAGLAYELAGAHRRLSQLIVNDDREAARSHLEASTALLERLASESSDNSVLQVDLLESQWAITRFDGFSLDSESLSRVAEIRSVLPELWPSEPATLYRAVCGIIDVDPGPVVNEPPSTAAND